MGANDERLGEASESKSQSLDGPASFRKPPLKLGLLVATPKIAPLDLGSFRRISCVLRAPCGGYRRRKLPRGGYQKRRNHSRKLAFWIDASALRLASAIRPQYWVFSHNYAL